MNYSGFAKRFSHDSGIVQLMDDLGSAMAANDMLMLGGGNPSHIPPVQQYFFERLQRLVERPAELSNVIGNYDPPAGEQRFIDALVNYFNERYGWRLSRNNIALTAGSQAAFFLLFNMFAGDFSDGKKRRVMLPMSPEYIGYADLGLQDDMLISYKPLIQNLDDHFFKYHVDFSQLQVTDEVGAICVSRPGNPTGNVITSDEINTLALLAEQNDIPLIIDNAYGLPFPNIIFDDIEPVWNQQIILCLSLSKLGLPGVRTGIVVADEEVIDYLSNMSAIMNLSQGSFGPALAYDVISSGEISSLCNNIIRPFYQQRMMQVVEWIKELFVDINYRIHKPEGAIFLWLWFPELTINSQQLYENLKQQTVLVIPGQYFFPGLDDDWQHKQQCIRITYSQSPEVVRKALELIAAEIRKL